MLDTFTPSFSRARFEGCDSNLDVNRAGTQERRPQTTAAFLGMNMPMYPGSAAEGEKIPLRNWPYKQEWGGLAFHKKSIGMLVFPPCVMFALASWSVGLFYHRFATILWIVFIPCFLLSCLFLLVNPKNAHGPFYLYLGILCMFALLWGLYLGLRISTEYAVTSSASAFSVFATYSNVSPSEPAALRQDAGVIIFSNASLVDARQTLGYVASDGDTYCVAPILDEMTQTTANFWAVGLDCCEPLWNFQCDDVMNRRARSGLVVKNASDLFNGNLYKNFNLAVKQASAIYNLRTPDVPVMVHWVMEPYKYEKSGLHSAVLILFILNFAYSVVSIILGTSFHVFGGHFKTQGNPHAHRWQGPIAVEKHVDA